MTQFVTAEDGVRIAFETAGTGPDVVLVHGFGASRRITWKNTGWYQTLNAANHRVVAIDCRGHGESDKPHDIAAYDEGLMAGDIVAVMNALDMSSADIMGYSMGGYLAIRLMQDSPARASRVVLGGLGQNYFRSFKEHAEIIAEGLLAPDPTVITDVQAREFRTFGEKAGNDLEALAACIRRPQRILEPGALSRLQHSVLVVCGEQDSLTGSPQALATALNGRALVVPKRNHHSTVGDRVYKDAVVAFLAS